MTIELLPPEDSSEDLCDAEIEKSRKSKEKKLNLLKKLVQYVFENPEMFEIRHK